MPLAWLGWSPGCVRDQAGERIQTFGLKIFILKVSGHHQGTYNRPKTETSVPPNQAHVPIFIAKLLKYFLMNLKNLLVLKSVPTWVGRVNAVL